MHVTLNSLIASSRERELARAARRAPHPTRPRRRGTRIELRFAAPGDAPAISRVAALDGKPRPQSPTLVAAVDGEIVAALPAEGGQAVADPFAPTQDVVELLEHHAQTLRHAA